MTKPPVRPLLAAVLLGCATLPLHAGEPLPLTNPGFEKGLEGWEAYADEGKSQVIAAAAHSGKNGLRVTDDSDANGCMIESARFPCKPGKTYEVTFWARLINGEGAAVYLKFYDAGDQEVTPDTTAAVPAGTTDWKKFSAKAAAPKGAVKFMVWIHTGNAAKVTVDFDDLTLSALD